MKDNEENITSTLADNTYCQIQYWMHKKLGLKGTKLMIYGIIHGFCQDGSSVCYAPLDYMMQMTGLSKQAVITILQELVKKNLIVKEIVKQYIKQTKNGVRLIKASGCQYFCVYYTVASRQVNQLPEEKKERSEYFENREDKGKSQIFESRNLTRNENNSSSGVKKLYPAESSFFTPPSQVSLPNNNDNKTKKTSSIKDKLLAIHPSFIFENKIYTDADDFLSLHELNTDYLKWVYSLIEKRENIRNLPGYYLNMVFQEANAYRYKTSLKKNIPIPKKEKLCPVCGHEFTVRDNTCSSCNFELAFIDNVDEIELYQKAFYNLSAKKRIDFFEARRELTLDFLKNRNFEETARKMDDLLDRFGILTVRQKVV